MRLEVLDPQGRRVRTLESGSHPAGRLERVWDLHDQAGHAVEPGIYLVRARVGGQDVTRRVAVMR